jgi:hypothetical protein
MEKGNGLDYCGDKAKMTINGFSSKIIAQTNFDIDAQIDDESNEVFEGDSVLKHNADCASDDNVRLDLGNK